MLKSIKKFIQLAVVVADRDAEIARLKRELETERLRLAACGVVAMANTRESAARARTMHDDYWCASVSDVARAVDREMALREQLEKTRLAIRAAAASRAAADVLYERQRQIDAEGWTPEHDDKHDTGSLSAAAACYALDASGGMDRGYWQELKQRTAEQLWPWDREWWKPGRPPRGMLVKAGALILAEIERIDRAEAARG